MAQICRMWFNLITGYLDHLRHPFEYQLYGRKLKTVSINFEKLLHVVLYVFVDMFHLQRPLNNFCYCCLTCIWHKKRDAFCYCDVISFLHMISVLVILHLKLRLSMWRGKIRSNENL